VTNKRIKKNARVTDHNIPGHGKLRSRVLKTKGAIYPSVKEF
jgi:hypothetical protein